MTLPSSITNTTTVSGPGNQGSQVGYNSGSIVNHFHPPSERPETPPKPTCFVPFRRDPDFIDRATLLDQIHQRCAAPASRVALVGLGGVGKSQLAIEYCHLTAERSPETWIFWVHASNAARLEQTYRELADQVKVRGRKDPRANVFQLVHDWLRDEKNGPWLLVLDNADDAAVLSPELRNNSETRAHNGPDDQDATGGDSVALGRQLSRYLPPSKHGSVLVTSRTRHAALQIVEDSDVIPIETMDNPAARALIYQKLGDAGKEADSIDVGELATALDCMPLALVQAASYIRRRAPRCSVRQYLKNYRQSDSNATSLLNQEAGQLRRDETASNAILITWQISFNHVRSIRRSAADLLSLMSFFDRQGIPETLLRGSSDKNDDDFEDDILALRDYSFITATTSQQTFEMHNLVQLATRKWLENHSELEIWKEQFISNLCAELPNGAYGTWETCQTLFPHAKAALSQRPKSRKALEEWAQVLYKAASYAWLQSRAEEAEQMSVISMNVSSEMFGDENENTLKCMDLLGRIKTLESKTQETETIFRKVLMLRTKELGYDHPNTLATMGNLAGVLESQGRVKEGSKERF